MTESISLKQIFEEIKKIERNMVTKKEVISLTETVEIMSNPSSLRMIAESMGDVAHGRVKRVSSVKEMLDEI